jgi:hypothetical protein
MGKIWEQSQEFLETRRGALTALLLIFVLGVLGTVYLVDANVYGPMHFNDEVRYWEIALNLYQGSFSFAENTDYPPFYSISLLPAFYFFSPFARYAAARWLNAIYVTSAIIPAYLILRKFLNRRASLLAVIVLLCSPIQVVIPRVLISENTFYPLFMWAFLLAFTNLSPVDRKIHYLEDAAFGILLALLYATRFIALVLIPALLLIWWLKPFGDEKPPLFLSWKKVLHLAIVLAPMLALVGIWFAQGLADGAALKMMMGFSIADHPNPAQLGKRRLVMWMIFYLSYSVLIAAPYLGLMLASLGQFKIQKWREDANRWWVALAIIVFFFLLACVRHSWRAAYNYPDPVKLQGRYIMYFGPLFLISAFIYLKEQALPKRSVLYQGAIILLSCAMVVFSYAVLFEQFIFLKAELGASVNSPYGSLMRTLKSGYVALTLAAAAASILLIGRKRSLQIGIFSVLLIAFYLFGDVRIYQRILTSRQLLNSHIHNLLEVIEPYIPEAEERAAISLEIPSDSESRVIRSWRQSLNFAGYSENVLIPNSEVDADPNLVFRAEYAGRWFNLYQLTAEEYQQTETYKFSHSGYYYAFKELPAE